jgi:hypothetical protein
VTFLLLVGVTNSPYSFGCAALWPVLESRIVIVEGLGPFCVRSIATQGILTGAHAFFTFFFTRRFTTCFSVRGLVVCALVCF